MEDPMSDWVKCTPLGQPKRSIYINVERVVAVAGDENGSSVIYGVENGTDRGEIAVIEPPESILGGSRIRHS
jgi:hypothetical protein